MHPTADSQLEVPHPLVYACPSCSFVASSLPNLRRHQTVTHGNPQFRTCLGHAMSCSIGGLPQCTFCYQAFSTWRQFQIHLDRQCCQVRPCDQRVNFDALLREEEEQRILRLHQGLTETLQTKPYGADLLQLVQDRNWNRLVDLRPACEALAEQCCICDFHLSRPQELHNHLRVHHPQWTPHTFTKISRRLHNYAVVLPEIPHADIVRKASDRHTHAPSSHRWPCYCLTCRLMQAQWHHLQLKPYDVRSVDLELTIYRTFMT